MSRATFSREEWSRIVSLLRLSPEKEAKARRTLEEMRAYARERASDQRQRRNRATKDLEAAAKALDALGEALAGMDAPEDDPYSMPYALALLAQAGMLPEDVRQLGKDAARMRQLVGMAQLGPVTLKEQNQRTVIRDLAPYFTRRTGKPATSTRGGDFCALVRIVLGLGGKDAAAPDDGRASELIRSALAKPAKAAKNRARTR